MSLSDTVSQTAGNPAPSNIITTATVGLEGKADLSADSTTAVHDDSLTTSSDLGHGETGVNNTDYRPEKAIGMSYSGIDGFCAVQLANLPAGALIDEKALGACLAVVPRTIRRMVAKGQLPQGIKLGGKRIWLAGKILEHLIQQADRLMNVAQRRTMRIAE